MKNRDRILLPTRKRYMATLAASTILACGIAAPAAGQTAPPPVRQSIDENGVDVSLGTFNVTSTDVTIGDGDKALAYTRAWRGNGWRDSLAATINWDGTKMTVSIGGSSDSFTYVSPGNYTADQGNGATLTMSGSDYVYTTSDGTVAVFAPASGQYDAYGSNIGWVRHITAPNGNRTTYNYTVDHWCPDGYGSGPSCTYPQNTVRVQSLTNRAGYQLKVEYASNTLTDYTSLASWLRITKVTGINNAVEYCDPTANSCSLSGAWPYVTYSKSGTVETVADATGTRGSIHYDSTGQVIVGLKRTSASSDTTAVAYASGKVSSVTNEGVTYNYSWSTSGSSQTLNITGPSSYYRSINSNTDYNLIGSYYDGSGSTSYLYDSNYRINRIVKPEGNETDYAYDSRGNITQVTQIPKSGSGLSNIVTSANYPSTCANPVTCNKPTYTVDAKGNQTDFTYDPTHGGVTVVTAPAPVTSGIQPQTRYTYTTKQAYFKNSGGSIVASGAPIYVLASVSACQTTSSCAGAADEVKTTIDYGPQTSGTANNLLPVSTSSGAGDGSLTATTTASYDAVGNRTYVDGPLSGSTDTTRMIYDAARRVVGVISPDPDGGGALKNRAQRVTFNTDGQVSKVERGTTTGQSDSAWSGFSPAESLNTSYDANGRKSQDVLADGVTPYGVTQYSYDSLGRLDCTAVRMNPSAFGSLPGACTASTLGSYGPDRRSRMAYDAASRVTSNTVAYGETGQAYEFVATYNANGTTATLIDGNGNKTTAEYDGFDRISKTRYPSPMTAGTSSTTDFTQPTTYDANGNVTQMRLRDGQTISYTYDNLNRMTAKDRPNGSWWDTDYSYAYDLLGRLTTATHGNGYGLYYSFGYDALGRKTSEANSGFAAGNLTYQYDLAGRRTRMTWHDSYYVDYDHLVTGEITAIRENGATSGVSVLGSYAYDDLGRMTSLTRGNGVVTSYGYDAVSRLTSLAHDVSGSSYDVTTSFTYNPAGQIATSSRNNDAYAWGGHSNRDVTEAPNGLNQLTAQGSTPLGYDGRGNATSIGSASYTYSSENELTLWGANGYAYDPLGRLFNENISGGTNTTFQYDGSQIATETNASTGARNRRYVYGPGTDDPLVWYEGSDLSDRRWLIPDERGSVVAITNGSGTVTNINAYDEYGVPAAANVGRFQYTGQAWLPNLGMSYYKARIYNPAIGRFMQTDPIGYNGGMNMHSYVGGDPVNLSDPNGKDTQYCGSGGCVTFGSGGPNGGYHYDRGDHDAVIDASGNSYALYRFIASAGRVDLDFRTTLAPDFSFINVSDGHGLRDFSGGPAIPWDTPTKDDKPKYCTSFFYIAGGYLQGASTGLAALGSASYLAAGGLALATVGVGSEGSATLFEFGNSSFEQAAVVGFAGGALKSIASGGREGVISTTLNGIARGLPLGSDIKGAETIGVFTDKFIEANGLGEKSPCE